LLKDVKMKIIFIRKEDTDWLGDRYIFEIEYDGRESIDKYVKEFKLNCEHQIK